MIHHDYIRQHGVARYLLVAQLEFKDEDLDELAAFVPDSRLGGSTDSAYDLLRAIVYDLWFSVRRADSGFNDESFEEQVTRVVLETQRNLGAFGQAFDLRQLTEALHAFMRRIPYFPPVLELGSKVTVTSGDTRTKEDG